jgi:hypothetical protein
MGKVWVWTDLLGLSRALSFRQHGVGNSQERLLSRFGLEFTRFGLDLPVWPGWHEAGLPCRRHDVGNSQERLLSRFGLEFTRFGLD